MNAFLNLDFLGHGLFFSIYVQQQELTNSPPYFNTVQFYQSEHWVTLLKDI